MLKRSNLHDYQEIGFKHILDVPRCGLFLDMGLGKTVTSLTAANFLMFEEFEIDRILIIGPKRVAENVWSSEVNNWEHLKHLKVSVITGTEKQRLAALNTKADIYTVSRDNIIWLCSLFGGMKLPFGMVIIDESSSFKNPKSKRFLALKRAITSVSRVVILTGTPAPNGLHDLWSQIFLIDQGQRLGKTEKEYQERYFRADTRDNTGRVFKYVPRKDCDTKIYDKIKDLCISMKKEDYLDLQKPVFNYITAYMPGPAYNQYLDFEREKILELTEISELIGGEGHIEVSTAAALTQKLLQFANGAVYDEDKNVHLMHDAKLDVLEEIVEEANGKPVLVAYSFQHDKDRILKRFPYATLMKGSGAKIIEDWNAGKIPMLIMHPASGGHGLNIQKGGHIIAWFGLNWSLELYEQFNARLDRQGQKDTVIINHIITEGTMDAEVVESLTKKAKGQNALMKAVKARIEKYKKHYN